MISRSAAAISLSVMMLTMLVSGHFEAASPAPSSPKNQAKKEDPHKGEKMNSDPARDALNESFAADAKYWAATDYAAARAEYGKALAVDNTSSHCQSYAQLRIAQRYMAEENTTAAKMEYEKIKANAAYPEAHRYEAEDCVREIDRQAQGLPARDVMASRTTIPPISVFAAEFKMKLQTTLTRHLNQLLSEDGSVSEMKGKTSEGNEALAFYLMFEVTGEQEFRNAAADSI